MKIIENTKLIERNKKISKYTSYGALVFLGIGFYFTLQSDPMAVIYSLVALLIGLVVWQISMYFTSRWGAKVNPHELILPGACQTACTEIRLTHCALCP